LVPLNRHDWLIQPSHITGGVKKQDNGDLKM
jgi:hypothetical protein